MVWQPKKSRYQTQSRPWRTGRFSRRGASWKCSSMARNPANSSSKPSGPMASMVESPMAESIE